MFSMFADWAEQSPTKSLRRAPQAREGTFSLLRGFLCGLLRNLKVYLVHLNILWPGDSVRRIAKSEIYYVICSRYAKFMVSVRKLISENLRENWSLHFLPNRA